MIRVDRIFPTKPKPGWPYKFASHLFVDHPREIPSLHRLARRIGLEKRWFQGRARETDKFPHYDVTTGMRRKAVQAGARPATRAELGKAIQAWRRSQGWLGSILVPHQKRRRR